MSFLKGLLILAALAGGGHALAWHFVDGGLVNGINYDQSQGAQYPQLAVFNDQLYAAWDESCTYSFSGQAGNCIHVSAYNGSGWSLVDGGTAEGLFPGGNPRMAVFNGKLYLTWWVNNGTADQIRVAAFDGSSWSFADGGASNGINYDPSKNAGSPALAVFNGKLYATWAEGNASASQIRVRAYDGSIWTWADGGTANGINYSSSEDALDPRLAVLNNTLYATWKENSGAGNSAPSQIRVKAYNGSSWAWEDGGTANGIDYDPTENAFSPELDAYNGMLYVTWAEYTGPYIYSPVQIRVKAYNGSVWTWEDGGIANGINYDPSRNAGDPEFAVFNNMLYAAWWEDNGYGPQIRVKAYNGSSWAWEDDGLVNGINYDPTEAAQYPQLAAFDNKLYATWQELNWSGVSQIRVKAGQ
ncbi:MAG: hypothetical protein M0Z75_12585 [Nitrospiraceae bacterium]|nr:hypothetical protein [Nitrospiraceae bacterium]